MPKSTVALLALLILAALAAALMIDPDNAEPDSIDTPPRLVAVPRS